MSAETVSASRRVRRCGDATQNYPRRSSGFWQRLAETSGVERLDLGWAGTEEVGTSRPFHLGVEGGQMKVTASHNPIDYNGLKLVRAGSSADLCLI